MRIRIPATSANLGCGFDTLGLALDLYNEFIIEPSPEDHLVGEERDLESHMVFSTRNLACDMLGLPRQHCTLTVHAQVPESSGLGSSATCILAGIIAALHLNGQPLDEQVILKTATHMEGHPDNVVPAYVGGLTASLDLGEKVLYRKSAVHEELVFLTVIPPFAFATAGARAAIPSMIRHRDAVANLSRVVLLMDALEQGKVGDLRALVHDELHEKYRLPLIQQLDPDYETLYTYCQTHARGTFLSGAGPTFIAVIEADQAESLQMQLQAMGPAYRFLRLKAGNEGTVVDMNR